MTDRPVWDIDGKDWPNRDASRFVRAGGITWHVQVAGSGPALLLVHGTGAATHSWRDLLPLLARDFTVIAPDLPGHGFTEAPPQPCLSLPGMSQGIAALLTALEIQPVLGAGHSAGAAIAARMSLDRKIALRALLSLNGALLPFRGLPEQIFSPVARLLAQFEIVPKLFAWRAGDPRLVDKLLSETGSKIDARGLEFYARLVSKPAHAAAALGMMAHWDLRPLERDLPRLRPRLTLISGANDRTIPPQTANRVRALVPGSTVIALPGLGHLAHEENPALTAELIGRIAAEAGVFTLTEVAAAP